MASSPVNIPLSAPSGLIQYHDADAEGTVKTVIAAATTLYTIKINNSANAAACYLKIFNNAGTVTLGTTVPDEIIYVPGSGTNGGIKTISLVTGTTWDTGVQVAITTTALLAGTTSPASSVILDVVHVPS